MSKKIKHISFMLMIMLVLTITGCSSSNRNNNLNSPSSKDNEQTDIVKDDDSSTTDVGNNSENSEKDNQKTESKGVEPLATKEISIYTMNESTLNVESVVALISQDTELTPELIVGLVVDSLEDRLVEVGIDEITTKEDTVIVSFLSDKAPLVNVGSGLEGTILDAIAQSLVENLPEYPKVIYRVEGKEYSSGHFIFGMDEVYLDGNLSN